ncbi:uncharacterized protein PFL1_01178 [Pseudozyma flocculosa PF-1]|uniref:Related to NTA1 - Amidase n=1 Tax=Pseudozyma flocculosa TaxID=84751 RepID=A0A5C3EWJ5_9BASI|nr:uncharacterized protein PFL1_01178 [Pseudozyma flocculosa PF-1]EPQ30989.1 hypothetical protein PFL1_01178 [Pseudozyma flocculosa PF-1]SPO35827.1 related to NTA1 - Amidase [Pseudozyma flocculosa]
MTRAECADGNKATPSPPVVACVQLDSKHADIDANIATVRRLVDGLDSDQQGPRRQIDLLVLPELALTGYCFDSHDEIEPLLEAIPPSDEAGCESTAGPTLSLVSSLAKRFQCHVLAGFAERGPPIDPAQDTTSAAAAAAAAAAFDARSTGTRAHCPPNGTGHAYNSALLVNPCGQVVHTFRKHFLYDDDKRWATEGSGFQTVELPRIGRVCVAICMDLNPHDFRAPFEAYELASFCRRERVDLIVVPMAWLLPASDSSLFEQQRKDRGPSTSSIQYWALRCAPLFDPEAGAAQATADGAEAPPRPLTTDNTTFLVAANRTGTEGKSTFAGSSCVLRMRHGERPELLAALGVHDEAVLCAQLEET